MYLYMCVYVYIYIDLGGFFIQRDIKLAGLFNTKAIIVDEM